MKDSGRTFEEVELDLMMTKKFLKMTKSQMIKYCWDILVKAHRENNIRYVRAFERVLSDWNDYWEFRDDSKVIFAAIYEDEDRIYLEDDYIEFDFS